MARERGWVARERERGTAHAARGQVCEIESSCGTESELSLDDIKLSASLQLLKM